jgi:tRNA(fMet)-specific endonuclease VapC
LLIIPFSSDEAAYAAEIRLLLKQAGTPIGAYDLLIGATALCHNLTLITANTKEFERIEGLLLTQVASYLFKRNVNK